MPAGAERGGGEEPTEAPGPEVPPQGQEGAEAAGGGLFDGLAVPSAQPPQGQGEQPGAGSGLFEGLTAADPPQGGAKKPRKGRSGKAGKGKARGGFWESPPPDAAAPDHSPPAAPAGTLQESEGLSAEVPPPRAPPAKKAQGAMAKGGAPKEGKSAKGKKKTPLAAGDLNQVEVRLPPTGGDLIQGGRADPAADGSPPPAMQGSAPEESAETPKKPALDQLAAAGRAALEQLQKEGARSPEELRGLIARRTLPAGPAPRRPDASMQTDASPSVLSAAAQTEPPGSCSVGTGCEVETASRAVATATPEGQDAAAQTDSTGPLQDSAGPERGGDSPEAAPGGAQRGAEAQRAAGLLELHTPSARLFGCDQHPSESPATPQPSAAATAGSPPTAGPPAPPPTPATLGAAGSPAQRHDAVRPPVVPVPTVGNCATVDSDPSGRPGSPGRAEQGGEDDGDWEDPLPRQTEGGKEDGEGEDKERKEVDKKEGNDESNQVDKDEGKEGDRDEGKGDDQSVGKGETTTENSKDKGTASRPAIVLPPPLPGSNAGGPSLAEWASADSRENSPEDPSRSPRSGRRCGTARRWSTKPAKAKRPRRLHDEETTESAGEEREGWADALRLMPQPLARPEVLEQRRLRRAVARAGGTSPDALKIFDPVLGPDCGQGPAGAGEARAGSDAGAPDPTQHIGAVEGAPRPAAERATAPQLAAASEPQGGKSTAGDGMRTAAAEVGKLPLGEMPLGEMPLGEMPLGEMPLGEMPLGEVGAQGDRKGKKEKKAKKGKKEKKEKRGGLAEGGAEKGRGTAGDDIFGTAGSASAAPGSCGVFPATERAEAGAGADFADAQIAD
eukprot:TRINITY_DN19248_c0_g1_i1.p2 TRINITY_DN19248_c0_g1~~TRINITY_DN19248_c0_g1_i1.p2  ORF type:complete len:928 (+),score=294.28 TRINITY_DN19248_c0_g1_i1:261-2786(+)